MGAFILCSLYLFSHLFSCVFFLLICHVRSCLSIWGMPVQLFLASIKFVPTCLSQFIWMLSCIKCDRYLGLASLACFFFSLFFLELCWISLLLFQFKSSYWHFSSHLPPPPYPPPSPIPPIPTPPSPHPPHPSPPLPPPLTRPPLPPPPPPPSFCKCSYQNSKACRETHEKWALDFLFST